MFAYIPARGGSKRISRKNIKSLNGKPIILHVIEQLLQIKYLSGVCVSTEDQEIYDLVSSVPGVTVLERRDERLADDKTTFMGLVKNDVPRFVKHFSDKEMLFVTATAALVKASVFEKAISVFREKEDKGLVLSVTEYPFSAYLALTPASSGEGIEPLYRDMYLRPTKDLLPTYCDSGCFYLFNFEKAIRNEALMDMRPIMPIVLPENVGIDIDDERDWQRLEAASKL